MTTIHITKEIEAAFEAYLNAPVDWDLDGKPILRRECYPYDNPGYHGLVDFAAGYQAGQHATSQTSLATANVF